MHLQQLELGMSAFQAKINSVKQYNLLSSPENVLGLPSNCFQQSSPTLAEDQSSGGAILCHECSSNSGSSEEGSDQKEAIISQGSREKDLKDFAYSKALVDFKVRYFHLTSSSAIYIT